MARLSGLLFTFFLLNAAFCLAETPDRSSIQVDWLRMELRVSGYSTVAGESGNMIDWQLQAARKAEENLLRNFVDSMKHLQVDAYRSAHDVLLDDLERNRQIYSYCNATRAGTIRYGEYDVNITKVFPFFGENGFVPILFKAGKDTGNFKSYDRYVFTTAFSGVVIDARGLARQPAISPRIFDEDHNLVYSADLVDSERFLQWGAVQYTTDPQFVEYVERVGANPFRIVAIEDDRLIATDIAIFTELAQVLLAHRDTRRRLEEGRVIVILDEDALR